MEGAINQQGLLESFTPDAWLLLWTRFTRLFAYGALSVVLVLYLTRLGLREVQVGTLLTLTLAGDAFLSLLLTTQADRIGRQRTLVAGAFLMAGAGAVFAFTTNLPLLMIAGTLGVISPSGHEVGPFLSIEQAALSQVIPGRVRTSAFAWYTLAGSIATALGSLAGGMIPHLLRTPEGASVLGYRAVVFLYAAIGILLALFFTRLSPAAEVDKNGRMDRRKTARDLIGVPHSLRIIVKLSCLFAIDSFAGGFVVQSFAAYWFYLRFGAGPASLGAIFFGANLLAGVSALLAARLASRFGLVKTMVFTHLPSNILLILVPLMPTLGLASFLLLLRFSISQMDVPTRQSYTMAVVRPEERSAAAGITGVTRTIGASLAPLFAGWMFAHPALISLPFLIAGGLKIVYDIALYRSFVTFRPPEEMA